MSDLIGSLYGLTDDDYIRLESDGLGKVIYGDAFPANLSVFKSEKARYLSATLLAEVVDSIVEEYGLSAEQVVEIIKEYGEDIGELNSDINNKLIAKQTITDIIEGYE